MTDKMSKDLIRAMRKKIKWLTAAVIVLAVVAVLLAAFAFSEFDLTIEYDDSQHVEQVTDGESGGAVTQNSEMNSQSETSTICGTVIGCVVILTIGAVICFGIAHKSKQVNARFSDGAEGRDD